MADQTSVRGFFVGLLVGFLLGGGAGAVVAGPLGYWLGAPSASRATGPGAIYGGAASSAPMEQVLRDEAITLRDDQWQGAVFTLDRAATLSVEARALNGRFHFRVMPRADFESDAQNAQHYPALGADDTTDHRASATLAPGEYAVVMREASRPNLLRRADVSTVQYRITVGP